MSEGQELLTAIQQYENKLQEVFAKRDKNEEIANLLDRKGIALSRHQDKLKDKYRQIGLRTASADSDPGRLDDRQDFLAAIEDMESQIQAVFMQRDQLRERAAQFHKQGQRLGREQDKLKDKYRDWKAKQGK